MSPTVAQFFGLLLLLCISRLGNGDPNKAYLSAYCNTKYCGISNLACRHDEEMKSKCIIEPKTIDMSTYKIQLLHNFNTFRNNVAVGYTHTLYPAGRMARMDWSQELESFAKMFIHSCSYKSPPCMASPDFATIGSIYDGLSYTGSPKLHNVLEMAVELQNSWFEDASFVTRDLMMKLSNDFPKPSVRDAVLLMTDRNTHVGCSATRETNGKLNLFSLICTFATDNIIQKPVYKAWAKPGALCKKRDTTYKNLCAIGESYNNNRMYQPDESLIFSSELSSDLHTKFNQNS